MAHYLVRAKPKKNLLPELAGKLEQGVFLGLKPFGRALSRSLQSARSQSDGSAVWEEEDYCSPPLAAERLAVLDRYFEDLSVEPVEKGVGWQRIDGLPRLFEETP